MEQFQFSVNVPGAAGRPPFKLDINRVSALIGSNGTGKSSILRHLASNPATIIAGRPVVYVEGGRVVPPPTSVRLDRTTINEFATLEQAKSSHTGKLAQNLSDRVKAAFFVLEQQGQLERGRHSDAVMEWQRNGQKGKCPVVAERPLDKLFGLFNELFPAIKIRLNETSRELQCTKRGGASYSVGLLSDGEKQALCLLADLAFVSAPNSIFLVDEPELNLHPTLADRLWTAIEAERPDGIFLYATHSIAFAMKESIEARVVISSGDSPPIQISRFSDISENDIREFLGAVPALLAAERAVAVEGTEASFDTIFYQWLYGETTISAVALGGGESVIAAATHSGIWEAVAPGLTIRGVVDGDFRADERKTEIRSGKVVVLDWHEAESYLCEPTLVSKLGTTLGMVETLPTVDALTNFIRDKFKAQLLQIAIRRACARSGIRLGVSLGKRESASLQTIDDAVKELRAAAELEVNKAHQAIGADNVEKCFSEEVEACNLALSSNSLDQILKYVPGKELLHAIAPKVGCRDALMFVRAARRHLRIEDFPHLVSLRQQLLG